MRKHRRRNFYFRNKIIEYFDKNLKIVVLLIILYFIGISLGILFLNNTNENEKLEITNYISEFVKNIKNTEKIGFYINIKDSVKQNIIIPLIFFVLGTTIIGLPFIYGMIIYKGYSLSYTIAAIIGTMGFSKGIIFVLTIFIPHLISIPVLILAGASSIKLNREIIDNKRLVNFKKLLIKHFFVCLTALFFLVLSSIIQKYIWFFIKPQILILWKKM